MPLWGNLDNATGNQKPLFANTSNAYSNSTINGIAANTNQYYGNVYGVSATEMDNVVPAGTHPQHSGWVSQKIGTGPIATVAITSRGQGINAAGFLILADTSWSGSGGSETNISFTIANTLNTLQSYSTNSTLNGINTITIVNGGSGWTNASAITYKVSNAANTTQPVLSFVLGGRGGRINYETLIATGSITGDDPRDNVFFVGV